MGLRRELGADGDMAMSIRIFRGAEREGSL